MGVAVGEGAGAEVGDGVVIAGLVAVAAGDAVDAVGVGEAATVPVASGVAEEDG